ncbi:glycosyltransferase family 2 protein [Microbacterium sp. SA39]|uniref:glycosyltransferase family 2 protein n=1 Tax=Microbacterium sp. SA39 TaxID=1263625 RepID=UPI0005FA5EDA|nr:glycosyltransferase family A protein [Microbacterium sp. SA39]KJQ53366.1 Glycosyl transferase family 2 [Microbacterium sp. SA39]
MSNSSPQGEGPPVLVAVTTYRRTELLPALVAAIRAHAGSAIGRVRIAIVDNDPLRSAVDIATDAGVDYVSEPTPGIAAARQAALDAARVGELVAMVDDDVMPQAGWLETLIEVWASHRPAVVMGYVEYVWPDGTDPWIVAGGFMRRRRRRTGQYLDALATGNVLIDATQVRSMGVRFDASLGLAGGEDMLFGKAVLAAGGSIVASADSVVRDEIPLARTTREFVRRRTVSQGQMRTTLLTRSRSPLRRVLLRALHLGGGVLRLIVFSIRGMLAHWRGNVAAHAVLQRRAWFAEGRILGALGRVTPEYARSTTGTA